MMSLQDGGRARRRSPVRSELVKQFSVVFVVAAIGVWQYHFVKQAATADIYIFVLLISAGFFGIYNAIKGTYSLGNDFVALDAMREIHQDAQRKVNAPGDHDQLIAQRLKSGQIIYNMPTSLGTAHNLIVEEIMRSGSLRIPTTTMQILVSDLEGKLDERQGMSHYLGALMVLLGLLGTFIGLMHTLESVGGILGSLDLSGNGGTGAIASLIESLKKPLEGMSTGFGASLFGLIGSLIIGILSKFDSKASHRLQHDFETWISSAVQIEGAAGHQQATAQPASVAGSNVADTQEAGNWRTVFQVARQTVIATSRISTQIAGLSESIGALSQDIKAQNTQTDRWFAHMTWALLQDTTSHGAVARGMEGLVASVAETKAKVTSQLSELADAVDATAIRHENTSMQLDEGLRKISDSMLLYHLGIFEKERRIVSAEDRISRMEKTQAETDAGNAPAAELIANLDHLIAASRLDAMDVEKIRRLSAVMAGLSDGAGEEENDTQARFYESLRELSK